MPPNRVTMTTEMTKFLDEHISALELEVRTINALEKADVFTVENLLNRDADYLLAIPNFGKKTLEHIYDRLEDRGFYRQGRTDTSN